MLDAVTARGRESPDPMTIPLVDLKAQYTSIKPEIDEAIRRVVENASFIMGPEVRTFESAFAEFVHVREAAGVASGTAALHLAFLACGIGPGDEVITTAFTFYATAEAIVQAGATPVFVDIASDTYNMDPGKIEAAIGPRTRAIVPVHLYGQAADMDDIMAIARRHNLWVIEDAAQAHAAEYHGRHCGSIGDIACFSFYPSKNLGCYGDGGMVTSDNADLIQRVRRLRDHGRTGKYEHAELGWGYRLDAIQAAILGAKLVHLEEWTEQRRAAARRYDRLLAGHEVITPAERPYNRHVYHCYAIRSPRRDALVEHLTGAGIGVVVHYPLPLHLQPVYRGMGLQRGTFPLAEAAADEVVSLPMFAEITEGQQARVAAAIESFAGQPVPLG
jgi:dTDP-4-amino-4,6-dideoxygalactose transaminase